MKFLYPSKNLAISYLRPKFLIYFVQTKSARPHSPGTQKIVNVTDDVNTRAQLIRGSHVANERNMFICEHHQGNRLMLYFNSIDLIKILNVFASFFAHSSCFQVGVMRGCHWCIHAQSLLVNFTVKDEKNEIINFTTNTTSITSSDYQMMDRVDSQKWKALRTFVLLSLCEKTYHNNHVATPATDVITVTILEDK